jgi:hypothetical protein
MRQPRDLVRELEELRATFGRSTAARKLVASPGAGFDADPVGRSARASPRFAPVPARLSGFGRGPGGCRGRTPRIHTAGTPHGTQRRRGVRRPRHAGHRGHRDLLLVLASRRAVAGEPLSGTGRVAPGCRRGGRTPGRDPPEASPSRRGGGRRGRLRGPLGVAAPDRRIPGRRRPAATARHRGHPAARCRSPHGLVGCPGRARALQPGRKRRLPHALPEPCGRDDPPETAARPLAGGSPGRAQAATLRCRQGVGGRSGSLDRDGQGLHACPPARTAQLHPRQRRGPVVGGGGEGLRIALYGVVPEARTPCGPSGAS